MEKEILQEIQNRRAYRAVSPALIPQEVIQRIIKAGTLAPSCMNKQPWRFLCMTSLEAVARGSKALSKGNAWAAHSGMLIAVLTRKDLDCNLPDGRSYAWFDLGLAVQNILLQSTKEGLIAHPMAGYSPAVLKEEFSIDEDYEVVVMIAVGFPGDEELLDEKKRAAEHAPRERVPLEQVFFENSWRAD